MLASFLMSAIKSSSSAFVSAKRGERWLEGPRLCAVVNLPLPQTWPVSWTESIQTHSKWLQVSFTKASYILPAWWQRCTSGSSSSSWDVLFSSLTRPNQFQLLTPTGLLVCYNGITLLLRRLYSLKERQFWVCIIKKKQKDWTRKKACNIHALYPGVLINISNRLQ